MNKNRNSYIAEGMKVRSTNSLHTGIKNIYITKTEMTVN